MKVKELVKQLDLEVLTTCELSQEVSGVYIGDLLSFVMSHAHKGNVWLTVQTHLNIVAIASLLELPAVIVVEDAQIDIDTLDKANEENIVIMKSNLTAYDLAVKINKLI